MDAANEFDLNAAWVRRSQSDFRAFMAGFAARMEGAFPGNVTVTRKRDGLLSSSRHVSKINIDIGRHAYTLVIDGARLTATRGQIIKNVTLKSEDLPVPDWLAALNKDLQELANQTGDAQTVLHDFLLS